MGIKRSRHARFDSENEVVSFIAKLVDPVGVGAVDLFVRVLYRVDLYTPSFVVLTHVVGE